MAKGEISQTRHGGCREELAHGPLFPAFYQGHRATIDPCSEHEAVCLYPGDSIGVEDNPFNWDLPGGYLLLNPLSIQAKSIGLFKIRTMVIYVALFSP